MRLTVPIWRLFLFRGKTCHSGHIALTAEKLAELRNEPIDAVLEYTRKNAHTLFGI